MLDGPDDAPYVAARDWLAAFEAALAASEIVALAGLFRADGHWRDLLALTWNFATVSGAPAVAAALLAHAGDAGAGAFELDPGRVPPRHAMRAGEDVVEAIVRFTTKAGRASGVLRLSRGGEGAAPKAVSLLTALEDLTDFPEATGAYRPTGNVYARDFAAPNWLDRRKEAVAYNDRDPAVLVVGGGQAGLSIAARLTALGVDTLVVDRWPRLGDNWRRRYHALTLHNQVHVNHLPYMPFPPTWPTYIPKDMVANWFEAYAEALELNIWSGCALAAGSYDDGAGRWTVTLERADGSRREMHPRHVVMATGVSGIPIRPDLPGLEAFGGAVVHTHDFGDGADWAGRDAIVVGTGNSGHDIAQDLHAHGARVTMVQRSPTLVVSVEPSAQLPYALYTEGPNLEDCDLLAAATPLALARRTHQFVTSRSRELDRDLLDGLRRIGFRLDFGKDDTGWQFKYLERGGGYYFNVGCSDLLIDGSVGLIQYDAVDRFEAAGARLKDGGMLPADLVVLATGYAGQDVLVRRLFGDRVADRVGPIWGFGAGQELRNMFVRTQQPGLWFIAGSFAQCRIFSKFLALQIKAVAEGLIPPTV